MLHLSGSADNLIIHREAIQQVYKFLLALITGKDNKNILITLSLVYNVLG